MRTNEQFGRPFDRELEAGQMGKEGRPFEAVMHLLNEGLTGSALVECQFAESRLSEDERVIIVAKWAEMGELDTARRFRYRWKLGDKLPENIRRLTSTRLAPDSEEGR